MNFGKPKSTQQPDQAKSARVIPRSYAFALEPRMLFDGAAMATADATLAESAPTSTATDTGNSHVQALLDATALHTSQATEPVDAAPRTEILFIENNVADYQTLVDGAKPGIEIHVLDADQNGLAQMAQVLEGRSGIDAIHIASHGTEGGLLLGSLTLTSQNLSEHTAELTAIGNALNQNADILLYGCDIGAGSDGQAFIRAIADVTKADVAASNDPTGAASLGGIGPLKAATAI
ncbi:DUF4347 domain-containing protein [Methylomonas albis]|uniref:DUF4347 domain-containing protein n=1 Tax=Methylomonas albis TaxID=1854563 RepID=A0ABR9CYP7_9GAMM|nr:DUF4347 domain-containing protein [Methylomonas albis]MBD9356011.1 DUF4347 domain-containing protein [Methylomonas albis]